MSDFEWNVGSATIGADILDDTSEELSLGIPGVNTGAFWRSRTSVAEAFERMEQLRSIISEASRECADNIRLSTERFMHCDMTVADQLELIREQLRDRPVESRGW